MTAMRFLPVIALVIACVVHRGESAASDACVDSIRCVPAGTSYNVFEDQQCSGAAINGNALRTCPAGTTCFGGRVGVSFSNPTTQGTGPCLAPPPLCATIGSFPITDATGRKVCNAFYDCAFGVAVGTTRACAGDFEFNVVSRKCEPKETAGCSIPSGTAPAPSCPKFDGGAPNCTCKCTSSIQAPVQTQVEAVILPPPKICVPGVRRADPNCRYYLLCDDTGLTETRRRCPGTQNFDEENLVCSPVVDCGTRSINLSTQ